MLLKILQNSQKNNSPGPTYLIKLQAALKKESPAQVFSCEFRQTFKRTILKNAFVRLMIQIISYPISSSLVSKCFSSSLLKTALFTLFSNFPFFNFFRFPIFLLLICSPRAVESHVFFLQY